MSQEQPAPPPAPLAQPAQSSDVTPRVGGDEPAPARVITPNTTDVQLSELRAALERDRSQSARSIEALAKQIDHVKELEDIKRQLVYFKAVGTLISIALGVVGFLGLKSITDVRASAERNLNASVAETTAYYSNLLAGYAHVTSRNYSAAIPILAKCFESLRIANKHYDSSVIAPLLMAHNEVEDWEGAERLIQLLEKDEPRLTALADAWVFLNIGAVRVQEALTDQSKLSNGLHWLGLAQRLTPVDDVEMRRDVYVNYVMASLLQGNLPLTRKYIAQAFANDQGPQPLDPWQDVVQWRFFREFTEKHPELRDPLRAMWTEQYRQRAVLRNNP